MKLPRSTALALSFLAATAASAATPASTLPLYVGQPLPGAQVMFGDFDVQQPLTADTGRMATDPKQPNAVVEARRTGKDAGAAGLGRRRRLPCRRGAPRRRRRVGPVPGPVARRGP